MEIRAFLSQVERTLGEMGENEVREWVYDYARKLPEMEREYFLQGLLKRTVEVNQSMVDERMFWASDWFDAVEAYEKRVYWIQDEETSDWDFIYEQEDEFEGLEDRDGVFAEFVEVLETIDFLVEANQFEDADELFERLFQMEMLAPIIWKFDGTEIDEEFVEATDLIEAIGKEVEYYNHLWLYVIVQNPAGPNFSRLFQVMKQRRVTDIDVIQTVGPRELKVDSFIEGWLQFLARTEGVEAYLLLKEACRLYKSKDFIEENLSDYGRMHPLFFLDVLSEKLAIELNRTEFDGFELKDRVQGLTEEGLKDLIEWVELAEEIISKEWKMGAEVMEVGFELALRLENRSLATHYRKQAFLYRSSVVNYLRLIPYLEDEERVEFENKWRIRPVTRMPLAKGLEKNTLSEEQKQAQLFFMGKVEDFYNVCKNNSVSLGWSFDLLGFGVPLFLLLLNKNSGQTQTMKWMEGYVFERLIDSERDRVYFTEAFEWFKERVHLSEQLEEEILQWLLEKIENRTEALLSNKHRNAYYRSAELILAYGEVLESRGEIGARMRMAEEYRQKYRYYRRFTSELNQRCRYK